jgi:hypothetical protein
MNEGEKTYENEASKTMAKKKERKTDGPNSPKRRGKTKGCLSHQNSDLFSRCFRFGETKFNSAGLSTLLEFGSGVESRPPLWTQRLSD